MNYDQILPALRALDMTAGRDGAGRLVLQLRDRLRIAPAPLVLSGAGYHILSRLDGRHTLRDVQEAFLRDTGQFIPSDEIRRVIDVLDHYLMLDTPRYAEAHAAMRTAYQNAEVRESSVPDCSPEELRQQLRGLLAAVPPAPPGEVRGLVAPHLDYGRGGPCYAAAYAALAAATPADRYVILGTNHFGVSAAVVATTKDFQTPLGRVATDRAFLARLEERLGARLTAEEHDHRVEHSVELQVHVLQVLQGERSFEIVPLLCPDICGPTGTAPRDGHGPDLAACADALAALVAADGRRTVLIAGADLSHVGPPFGDVEADRPALLAQVERRDRELLERLGAGDPEGLAAVVRASGNPTRVCSTGCLYAVARALRDRPCEILRYHQAVDRNTDVTVTCAAAVFR